MSADSTAAGAWSQIAAGDAVSRSIGLVLLAMSVVSWTLILSRSWFTWRASRSLEPSLQAFWQGGDPAARLAALTPLDRCGLLVPLASTVMTAKTPAERVRALRETLGTSRRTLQGGLTVLASIASTAPFVGLLGTVWGIYHALLGISASGQASIDRVAGPVGEALIMTAAGLAVAIPALLAYNALVRIQREILLRLEGFAHDLQALDAAA